MCKYKYLVSSLSVEKTKTICEGLGVDSKVIYEMDVRSALYKATGIAAQNLVPVIVLAESDNSSRSAFSGMTEAFYRNLPIVFITLGRRLDYSLSLNDTINGHYIISDISEMSEIEDIDYPAHIEIIEDEDTRTQIECNKLQEVLREFLDSEDYLYIGQGIKRENLGYKCKVVYGGTPNCYDGAIANLLGASLAGVRKRYIALISELELLHDINTLGNINMNDSIRLVVLCDKYKKDLFEITKSLGFAVNVALEKEINNTNFCDYIRLSEKSVSLVYKD